MQTIEEVGMAEVVSQIRSLGIQTPNPGNLADLLAKVPLKPLIRVLQAAARQFGAASELALERHREMDSEADCLVLQLRQEPYAADLIDRIDRFLKAREGDLSALGEFLVISTDFQGNP